MRSFPIRTGAGGWICSRAASGEPVLDGCACPTCAGGYSRAYLHYLLRAKELTAIRLLTLHNLTFVADLMLKLRAAIEDGRLPEAAAELRGGV